MLNHMLPGIRRIPLGYRVFVGIPSVSYVNTHVPSRFTAVEDHSAWAVGRTRTPLTPTYLHNFNYTQSAQTAKPRFLQPAHRRAGRIAEDLDDGRRAHDPGPRNVVVSVVARLGGAGEALPLVVHSRKSDSRDSRRVADRRAAVGAIEPRGRTASKQLVATTNRCRFPTARTVRPRATSVASATMTREPTRIRTDRARRRGSRVRPVRTPGPEIRGH